MTEEKKRDHRIPHISTMGLDKVVIAEFLPFHPIVKYGEIGAQATLSLYTGGLWTLKL